MKKWLGREIPKNKNMLTTYTNPLLSGSPCIINDDFTDFMNTFCNFLSLSNCKAIITSSYRPSDVVSDAIVTPAQHSNHEIGMAVDVNLIDSTGVVWNSTALKTPSGDVLDFIQLMESAGYRWGGEFHQIDSVHFDNGCNVNNPEKWKAIYAELHPAT